MKVFKDKTVSPLFRPFGIKGEYYLGLGALVFFDLADPEALRDEQELWSSLPGQLGSQFVVDQAIPKPRGEVLASGSCFTPGGQSMRGCEVSIRVGNLKKALHVFGDRFWNGRLITDPTPFTRMDLTWDKAFGGPDFPANPKGKGAAEIVLPDGRKTRPLPNIEIPGRIIGSLQDAPPPAGFGPLDLTWPPRSLKCGTYDDKWLRERWPFFPDDMNYEFFNTAPEDQFLGGFFDGGEEIEIVNMHPERPVIRSRVPSLRLRAFVTVDTTWRPHRFPPAPLPSAPLAATDEFRELKTRLDTVWLFPSIMRGLLVFRASTKVSDDEYADATRLMLALESQSDEPKTIEQYRDRLALALNRGVNIDMAPFEQAKAKMEPMLKRLGSISKELDDARQRALGNSPAMPMATPAQMGELAKSQAAQGLATLDKLEALARDMHAKYGHLAEIDLTQFDKMRGQIADMQKKTDAAVQKLAQAQEKLQAAKDEGIGTLKARLKKLPPDKVAEAGIDPDNPMPEPSLGPWHDRGMKWLAASRWAMLVGGAGSAGYRLLTRMGFERRSADRAWLAVSQAPLPFLPEEWGLPPAPDQPAELPSGLVMPRFDGKVLVGLRVRPLLPDGTIPLNASGEQPVPGSDAPPLFLPAASLIELPTLPAAESAPAIVAADELQALYLEQEAGDFASVLTAGSPDAFAEAMGGPAKKALAKSAPVLVVAEEGFEPEGKDREAWQAWLAACPKARPLVLPHGRTVFEAREKGDNLRDLILAALPPDFARAHQIGLSLPTPPKAGQPFDIDPAGLKPNIRFPDLKAIIPGIIDEVRQAMEAKLAPVMAQKDAAMAMKDKAVAKAKAALARAGKDPSALDAPPPPPKPIAQAGEEEAARLDAQRLRLKAAGKLPPETEAKMLDASARLRAETAKAGAFESSMKAQLAAKKDELKAGLEKLKAAEPPEEAKKKLAAHGLDPDKIRPLTREQVVEMHGRGESLAGAILSGVDLSGLDLTGADFTQAQLKETNFAGSILDRATLVQVMGQKADFGGASLKGATMQKGIFKDAVFKKADLTGTRLNQAVLSGTDLTEAVLEKADLEMAILEKVKLADAGLAGARVHMCIVADADMSRANLEGARLTKCLLNRCTLDEANFQASTVNQTLLQAVKGEKVSFAGANLDKLRMTKESVLPGADFRQASMHQASLRDSSLAKADFSSADMEEAIIENCELTEADFLRTKAKRARFTKSNLEKARMTGVNLMNGSLRKARIVDTDLSASNLYAVDFYKAVMGKTGLRGSNLKRSQLAGREDLLK